MSEAQRNALMRRWALLFTIATGLFWGTWHLVVGSIPMSPTFLVIPMPFVISRAWDILLAPIFPVLFIYGAYQAELYEGVAGFLLTWSTVAVGATAWLCGGTIASLDAMSFSLLVVGLIAALVKLIKYLQRLAEIIGNTSFWEAIRRWTMALDVNGA